MNDILLTIAVPTYNGAMTLAQTLDSVNSELLALNRKDVILEVFDNASSGSSLEQLKTLRLPSGSLVHFGEQNIGYDKNIVRAVESSKGKFVKILADDDLLAPGSLAALVKILEDHQDIAFLVSDFTKFSSDMSHEIEKPILEPQCHGLHTVANDLLMSRERFGQVSTLVFNRTLFGNLDLRHEIGSNYIHVFAVYALAACSKYFIMCGSNILVRDGSPNFSQSDYAIVSTPVLGLKTIANLKNLGFSKKFVRTVYKQQARYLSRTFLYGKKRQVKGLGGLFFEAVKVLGLQPRLVGAVIACAIPAIAFDAAVRVLLRESPSKS